MATRDVIRWGIIGCGDVTEVKVESVRPKKEKHETLRFLKDNRDFIRAQFTRRWLRPIVPTSGS